MRSPPPIPLCRGDPLWSWWCLDLRNLTGDVYLGCRHHLLPPKQLELSKHSLMAGSNSTGLFFLLKTRADQQFCSVLWAHTEKHEEDEWIFWILVGLDLQRHSWWFKEPKPAVLQGLQIAKVWIKYVTLSVSVWSNDWGWLSPTTTKKFYQCWSHFCVCWGWLAVAGLILWNQTDAHIESSFSLAGSRHIRSLNWDLASGHDHISVFVLQTYV